MLEKVEKVVLVEETEFEGAFRQGIWLDFEQKLVLFIEKVEQNWKRKFVDFLGRGLDLDGLQRLALRRHSIIVETLAFCQHYTHFALKIHGKLRKHHLNLTFVQVRHYVRANLPVFRFFGLLRLVRETLLALASGLSFQTRLGVL